MHPCGVNLPFSHRPPLHPLQSSQNNASNLIRNIVVHHRCITDQDRRTCNTYLIPKCQKSWLPSRNTWPEQATGAADLPGEGRERNDRGVLSELGWEQRPTLSITSDVRHGMWRHANSESPRQSPSLRCLFSGDRYRTNSLPNAPRHGTETTRPCQSMLSHQNGSEVMWHQGSCSAPGQGRWRKPCAGAAINAPGAAWCPSSLYSTERLLSTVLRPHCRERCWPKASWLETESVMSLMSPWGWGSDPLTHTQFWSVHSKGRRRQRHIC